MYYDSKYDVNLDNGMVNFGSFARIKKAMAKAMKGEPVTVGFLGGSITQGSLSSTPETCYAYLVYRWWKESFPESRVTYINAGIGGTPSNFGVARVDDDLLKYRPDFTVVEFSVNDSDDEHFRETYEGLVRHILKDESKTGLLLISNVRYDNMESAENQHLLVGKYYDLPHVSMKHSVYPFVANGSIPNREITPDDLHPNDEGHKLLADLVIHMLEIIKCDVCEEDLNAEISTELPKPLTKNGYENSVRLQNTNSKPTLYGFSEDPEPQNNILELFKKGYTAWKKGDRIVFKTECDSVAVQFRKSIRKPTPVARVTVDGKEEYTKILDGNFDEDWGDCIYIETVAKHMGLGEHEVSIEIIEDHGDSDVVPFYLVAVIASR